MAGVDGGLDRLFGFGEFPVAGPALLQALDVRAEFVGDGDYLLVFDILLDRFEERREVGSEFLGKHVEQALAGGFLDLAVRLADGGVEILDGAGQVADDHLAGVVVHGQQGDALGVEIAAVQTVADDGQDVGDHGDLQAVLLQILPPGVAHEAPAGDELHLGQIREEVAHSGYDLSRLLSCKAISPLQL